MSSFIMRTVCESLQAEEKKKTKENEREYKKTYVKFTKIGKMPHRSHKQQFLY